MMVKVKVVIGLAFGLGQDLIRQVLHVLLERLLFRGIGLEDRVFAGGVLGPQLSIELQAQLLFIFLRDKQPARGPEEIAARSG